MKRTIVAVMAALCLIFAMPVMAESGELVEIQIVERVIPYRTGWIKPKYPLLSYDGFTYISVKDAAEVLGSEAQWDGDKTITFKQTDDGRRLITKDETALAIGMAVIEEYFPDRDNAHYYVTKTDITGAENFGVYVKFSTEEILGEDISENADAIVLINPSNGVIEDVCERDQSKMVSLLW